MNQTTVSKNNSDQFHFSKLSGSGNDFILIDNRKRLFNPDDLSRLARLLCRRKFSVGADGFIAIEDSETADFRWQFFNADGTKQAEEVLDLNPLGSVVDFFNSSLPDGFQGRAEFTCDAPVVVVAVNQDFSNGNFPTDRLTIKGSE